MAALDDVVRIIGNNCAYCAWHGNNLTNKINIVKKINLSPFPRRLMSDDRAGRLAEDYLTLIR